jgi:hypothetical protein
MYMEKILSGFTSLLLQKECIDAPHNIQLLKLLSPRFLEVGSGILYFSTPCGNTAKTQTSANQEEDLYQHLISLYLNLEPPER